MKPSIWDRDTIIRDREIRQSNTNYFTKERREADERDRQRAIEDIRNGRVDPDGLDG